VKRALLLMMMCVVSLAASAQEKAPAATLFGISGTAVNRVTGAPIPGAKITIQSATDPNRTADFLTNRSGQFAFANLTPGKYSMIARGKGFRPQAFEEHENYSSAIVVGPGKRSTGLVFRIQPEATITGQVMGAFSEPVGEGQVYLFRDGIQNGTHFTRLAGVTNLDEDGVFRFKHLPVGHFFIAVVATPWFAQYAMQVPRLENADADVQAQREAVEALLDYAYPVTYFGDVLDPGSSTPVVTRAGETTVANINLTPVRATRIIVDAGAPVTAPNTSRNFTLEVPSFGGFDFNVPVRYSGVGPNAGMTELRGMAPGHYKLSMNDYSDGPPRSHTREIDADRDGSEIGMGDLGATTATLSGKLILDNGAVMPPPGGFIHLIDQGRRRGYDAKLDAKGDFNFAKPIEPGTYQVFIVDVPYFVLRGMVANGADIQGRTLSVNESTGAVKLMITASRGVGVVTGTAMDVKGPMAGAMIVLVPEDLLHNPTAIRRDQSDSDGTFTLPQIVPGRYTVLALRNGWEMEWNNPEFLRSYLAKGTPVVVTEKSEQDVKVTVQ
jgi:hypothetical protein